MKLTHVLLLLLVSCSMQGPESEMFTPLNSLEKYGLCINSGDSYKYQLQNSYFGPRNDSSRSGYGSLSEEAVIKMVIRSISKSANRIILEIEILYQGIQVTSSRVQNYTDTVKIDTVYLGTIELKNSTFMQNIDGFSIQLFNGYVLGSSHSGGDIVILDDTLHYEEVPSIFSIDMDQTLLKQSLTASSWNSVDFFIIENAAILWKEISVASGLVSQRYLFELVSINDKNIVYPTGTKPYSYISP